MSPRDLSTTAKEAIHARVTSEAFLYLLTITHDDLPAPIRVVNNMEDVVSRSLTYTALAFEIPIPDSKDKELPSVQLVICNVDPAIVQAIRSISSPPSVTLELILDSDPDTVEAGPFNMTLRVGEYDQFTVSSTLRYEDILDEAFPSGKFDPPDWPALFQ